MDLIDSMIMLEPSERLGAPGSKNGMENLKKHPFFSGINWDNLQGYDLKVLLEMNDGYKILKSPTVKRKKAPE